MITVAFKSPYDPKRFVKLSVPNSLSLHELRESGKFSVKALSAANGVTREFADYPLCSAGALGLMILSKCCSPEEDPIVMGMIGAFSFAKQTKSKLENRGIDEEMMIEAINHFKVKYGCHFKKFASERLGAELAPWRDRMMRLLEENA